MKKPLYNSNTGRTARPRIAPKRLGVMSRELKAEVLKYGITKMDVGMCLIGLGVNVITLSQ